MSLNRTFKPRDLMRQGFEELFKLASEPEGAYIHVKGSGSGSGFAQSRYPQFAGKRFLVTMVDAEKPE